MKPILRLLLAVLVLGTLSPGPAHAQLGTIIDMIQKMSGPAMRYYGLAYRWGYQPGQERPRRTAVVPGIAIALEGMPRDEALACVTQTQSLLADLDAEFYDERRVDRFRESRRRLNRLANRIHQDTVGGATMLWREYANIACGQPRLLRGAVPDPLGGFTWRLGLYGGSDTRDDRPADTDVYGAMAQLTLEYLAPSPMTQGLNVGVEFGASLHYFFGDIDGFFHPTFPVRLNIHPFARCEGWLLRNFRFGTGFHLIPPFRSGAFEGLYAMDDEWEATWNPYFIALDISRGSFSSPAIGC